MTGCDAKIDGSRFKCGLTVCDLLYEVGARGEASRVGEDMVGDDYPRFPLHQQDRLVLARRLRRPVGLGARPRALREEGKVQSGNYPPGCALGDEFTVRHLALFSS